MPNKTQNIKFKGYYYFLCCSIILLLSLSANLFAVEPFSLDSCIEYAVSHNPGLLAAKQDVEIAKSGLMQAKSVQLPVVTGSLSFQDYAELPIIVTGFGEFPMGWKETYDLQVSITQPLYTGGRISRTIQQAKYQVKIAEASYRQQEQELVYTVKQAFYNILLSQELVRVNQQAVDLAVAHLRNAESHFRAGTVSNYEVLRAEVEVANSKPELIQANNRLKLAGANLKAILGLPAGEELAITGKLEYILIPVSYDTAVMLAFNNRPDWQTVGLNEQIAELGIAIAASGTKPMVTLTGIHDRKTDTLDAELGGWNQYSLVMLGVTWSFYDGWATKAKVAQSRSTRIKTQYQKEQVALNIRLEVEQAVLDLQSAQEIIISQQKTIEQAKESLRLAETRYKNGVGTQLEVLDAEVALTRAETNYAQALATELIAQAKLEQVTGIAPRILGFL